MTGLSPAQHGFLLSQALTSGVLLVGITYVWLYRHRYTLRGIVNLVRRHL